MTSDAELRTRLALGCGLWLVLRLALMQVWNSSGFRRVNELCLQKIKIGLISLPFPQEAKQIRHILGERVRFYPDGSEPH